MILGSEGLEHGSEAAGGIYSLPQEKALRLEELTHLRVGVTLLSATRLLMVVTIHRYFEFGHLIIRNCKEEDRSLLCQKSRKAGHLKRTDQCGRDEHQNTQNTWKKNKKRRAPRRKVINAIQEWASFPWVWKIGCIRHTIGMSQKYRSSRICRGQARHCLFEDSQNISLKIN